MCSIIDALAPLTVISPLTKIWCPEAESNHRHGDFQSPALPTELSGRVLKTGAIKLFFGFKVNTFFEKIRCMRKIKTKVTFNNQIQHFSLTIRISYAYLHLPYGRKRVTICYLLSDSWSLWQHCIDVRHLYFSLKGDTVLTCVINSINKQTQIRKNCHYKDQAKRLFSRFMAK